MSATDELRRLLDERGVEWFESVTRKGLTWIYRDGKAIRFHPWQPDTLKVSMFDLTPEQAVEATLGRGTCKLTMDGTDGCFGCSECLENIPPLANYCPNCGRKIKED